MNEFLYVFEDNRVAIGASRALREVSRGNQRHFEAHRGVSGSIRGFQRLSDEFPGGFKVVQRNVKAFQGVSKKF